MDNLSDKLFLFWSRSIGQYQSLCSELSTSGWTVLVVQSAASLSRLSATVGKFCCLAILDPVDNFSPADVREIRDFISRGNSALIAISATKRDAKHPQEEGDDDDEAVLPTNINNLTRLYGVELNEDCVIRPNPYKLFHPKEAMLEDFVANRGLGEVLRKHIAHKPSDDSLSRPQNGPIKFGARIIYPWGRTLKMLNETGKTKSTIMMTSSRWTLPGGQPICSFYRDDKLNSNVIVIGSAHLVSDAYLDKEDNKSLLSCFLDFLSSPNEGKSFPINISDARTIEIAESNMSADMSKLIQMPFGCLQEPEPLPKKMTDLIDVKLFGLDNTKLALVMNAHRDLNVAYEPLTLMRPLFEWPVERHSNDKDESKTRSGPLT